MAKVNISMPTCSLKVFKYMYEKIANTEISNWTDYPESTLSLNESVVELHLVYKWLGATLSVQPWYTVSCFLFKSVLKGLQSQSNNPKAITPSQIVGRWVINLINSSCIGLVVHSLTEVPTGVHLNRDVITWLQKSEQTT